jgi:hypothetical protein
LALVVEVVSSWMIDDDTYIYSICVQVPSARVLQETCSYIRSLHREVDDLSDRLSELLATADVSNAQAAVIRSLLM